MGHTFKYTFLKFLMTRLVKCLRNKSNNIVSLFVIENGNFQRIHLIPIQSVVVGI